MAIARLIPSTYTLSNTTYLKITNPNNMYANTDSTNYATVTNSQTGTTSYYIYIKGFNFSAIPSDAIINSFTVKLKANMRGGTTSTSYRPYLCNNTTALTNTYSNVIATTVQTITFANGTYTWEDIKSYGANFGIRVNCRRNSRNTSASFNFYGAEIEVDYTIPVYHDITTSCTNGTIEPSSVTQILEGSSQTFKITGSTGREELSSLTYNGSNVLSQAVRKSGSELGYEVSTASGASYGFALNGNYYVSQNKGKSSSCALCRVDFNIPVECTVNFYVINYAESGYDYGLLSNIDKTLSTSASADSSNVFWNGSNKNSASEQKVTYTIPSGEHYVTVKFFKDSYTDSNNDTLQFRVEIIPNEDVPSDTLYYEFTIASVDSDGTLVAVFGTATQPILYVKENGTWKTYSAVYKKVNGAWVQQTNLASVFDVNTKYLKS